jgi:hypothetical protein
MRREEKEGGRGLCCMAKSRRTFELGADGGGCAIAEEQEEDEAAVYKARGLLTDSSGGY